MSFVLDLLGLPVLGPARLVHWLATDLTQEAEREFLDEGLVRGELLELQQRLEMGTLSGAEYDQEEKELLTRLADIRELKAQRPE